MSLHADVSIPGSDRRRIERLGRTILRPPVTLDRLEAHPDGRLAYRFKTPWRDGTTHVLMERHELLERLAPLIPPPRAHPLRDHGILAPCASGRSQVVPAGGRADTACVGAVCGQNERAIVSASNGADAHTAFDLTPGSGAAQRAALGKSPPASGQEGVVKSATGGEAKPTANPEPLASRSVPATRSSRTPWSELLKRVFGVDALRCPCGKTMRVRAAITDPVVAKRILECTRLPPRAPPLGPARAPNSAAHPSIEDLVAADFDQTLPWDDWSQAP